MADITMCEGTGCPLRATCYRFKAKSDEFLQSYFAEVPYDSEYEKCSYYWEIISEETSKQQFYDNLNYKGD